MEIQNSKEAQESMKENKNIGYRTTHKKIYAYIIYIYILRPFQLLDFHISFFFLRHENVPQLNLFICETRFFHKFLFLTFQPNNEKRKTKK